MVFRTKMVRVSFHLDHRVGQAQAILKITPDDSGPSMAKCTMAVLRMGSLRLAIGGGTVGLATTIMAFPLGKWNRQLYGCERWRIRGERRV